MTPDYRKLIDPEVWAFLKRCEQFYPPDAVTLGVTEQRQVYDKMCAAFDVGHPAGVASYDRSFGEVPCRVYESSAASSVTVFFCHGGGFVVGGLNSHDSICAEFSAKTGFRLVAVDYRLSPEHPHPEDFNDALAAFDAVYEAFQGPIVMCGDSAGGNLVAAVTHFVRTRNGASAAPIVGQMLIYPALGSDPTQGSYVTHANAPGLSARDMTFYTQMRSGEQDKSQDPTFAPLQDARFDALPATVVISAACDPLASDGEQYCNKITAQGGAALWRNEAGLVHAYLRARFMSSKAGASFERITRGLVALGKGQLPDYET